MERFSPLEQCAFRYAFPLLVVICGAWGMEKSIADHKSKSILPVAVEYIFSSVTIHSSVICNRYGLNDHGSGTPSFKTSNPPEFVHERESFVVKYKI